MNDNNRHTEQLSQGEDGDYLEIVVDANQSPIRIDLFLMDKISKVSRSKIQKGIQAGLVTVNDAAVKVNYKIRPLEVIKVIMPASNAPSEVIPEDIPLDIQYEDDDLLIVCKPSGMVVHPGFGNWTGTLVNALAHYLQKDKLPLLPGNQADRPGLVHRIDKDTSGLLVIAKTDAALTHLAKQFYDHTVLREYIAIVWGEPAEARGTIDAPIGRDPKNRLIYRTQDPDGEYGKHAITHYEVVEGLYYVSKVLCRLETGRTHQIRVHMNSIGHPLFNDARYGGSQIRKGTVFAKYKQFVHNCFEMCPRHALHARSLGFVHPTTGKDMHFEMPLPEDMLSVWKKWSSYVDTRRDSL